MKQRFLVNAITNVGSFLRKGYYQDGTVETVTSVMKQYGFIRLSGALVCFGFKFLARK